jgi:hypothetical protein
MNEASDMPSGIVEPEAPVAAVVMVVMAAVVMANEEDALCSWCDSERDSPADQPRRPYPTKRRSEWRQKN